MIGQLRMLTKLFLLVAYHMKQVSQSWDASLNLLVPFEKYVIQNACPICTVLFTLKRLANICEGSHHFRRENREAARVRVHRVRARARHARCEAHLNFYSVCLELRARHHVLCSFTCRPLQWLRALATPLRPIRFVFCGMISFAPLVMLVLWKFVSILFSLR